MHKHLLTVLLAALFAALFLAACGGDSGSDEDDVATAVESAATSTDPADCTVYSTQAFMEQTEIETGKAAVKSCEEGAEDASDDPDSVSVDAIEIDGDQATAEASFEGGSFDGQTLAVSLVEEDGDWKLDRVERFVGFDRDAFATSFEASLEGAELTDAQGTCLREAIDSASDEELEGLVISGSEEGLVELFGEC